MLPRHFNYMTMESFYELYVMWAKGNDDDPVVASSRCFRDHYHKRWKSILKMREVSQHARPEGGSIYCLHHLLVA